MLNSNKNIRYFIALIIFCIILLTACRQEEVLVNIRGSVEFDERLVEELTIEKTTVKIEGTRYSTGVDENGKFEINEVVRGNKLNLVAEQEIYREKYVGTREIILPEGKEIVIEDVNLVINELISTGDLPGQWQIGETLLKTNFEQTEPGNFPQKIDWDPGNPNQIPSEQVFKVVKKPEIPGIDNNVVTFEFPSETEHPNHCYLITPFLSSGTEYILIEFDFYMDDSGYDVEFNAGLYIFGDEYWPYFTREFLNPSAISEVVPGEWGRFSWILDNEAREGYLILDGEIITTRPFDEKISIDNFRLGIWSRTELVQSFYNNLRIIELNK